MARRAPSTLPVDDLHEVQALYGGMTDAEYEDLLAQYVQVVETFPTGMSYSPHQPQERQAVFLADVNDYRYREALYGGAVGGGKSDALLMGALKYVHIPGYAALLLRRTYPELYMRGALLDRAREWLAPSDAVWRAFDKTWVFPSQATISFGFLQDEAEKYRYQSAEFQYIAFDELTEFEESQYSFLLSRLRKTLDMDVPLRMRAATNPIGPGVDWVYERFVKGIEDVGGEREGHLYVPATLDDNRFIDTAEYEESLKGMDPVTLQQLRHGNWHIRPQGPMFQKEWFTVVDAPPPDLVRRVRYWDLAATEEVVTGTKKNPDWLAGCMMAIGSDGVFYILDLAMHREGPADVEQIIKAQAKRDQITCAIRIEQEPGASGKLAIHQLVKALAGFNAMGIRSTGKKVVRAEPMAAQAKIGNIKVVRGDWNRDFFNHIVPFPTKGFKDDPVDAASGAFAFLAETMNIRPVTAGQRELYKRYQKHLARQAAPLSAPAPGLYLPAYTRSPVVGGGRVLPFPDRPIDAPRRRSQ